MRRGKAETLAGLRRTTRAMNALMNALMPASSMFAVADARRRPQVLGRVEEVDGAFGVREPLLEQPPQPLRAVAGTASARRTLRSVVRRR